MEKNNQIKINIWGIRGGFRSFCHSEDLNVEEPEIKNTWKDIRDFVYVSDLSVRFFALEFTPTYKVYTLYRPVNDTSRTGAYVAVTLYVPHGLKVTRLVDLLRQISDAYHKDHYDAFDNPNSNPDYVQLYVDIINGHAAHVEQEPKKRMWSASTQNNTPKILPYNDINVLEIFFTEPYRKEFLACQEVMFWDSQLLRDLQAYGVKFQKADSLNKESCFQLNGVDVKEQFKGGQIKNQPTGCDIANFKCNGVDITGSWMSAFFEDQDDIEVVLNRPFYDFKVYRGAMTGVGSIFVKRGAADYEFGLVNLNPRRYSSEIVVPTELVGKGFDLYVDNNPVSIEGARGVLNFYGNELDAVKKIWLRYGNASFLVMELRLRDLFENGNDALAALIKVDNLKLIKFEFDHPCKGKLSIDKQELGVDTGSGYYCDFVLPADVKTDVSTLAVEVEDTKAKIESKNTATFRVSLTSSVFYVGIDNRESIQSFVNYNYFKFKVNGKIYNPLPGFKFKLPIEESAAVKKKDGLLGLMVEEGQNALPCEYEIVAGNGLGEILLKPNLVMFYNEMDNMVTLKSDKFKPINILSRKRVLLPLLKWEIKAGYSDGDPYLIEDTYGGFRQFVVRQKLTQVGIKSENTVKHDYLCYYFGDGGQPFVLNGNPVKYSDYQCYTINDLIPGRNVKLCFRFNKTPYPEKTEMVCAKYNSENGFEVGLYSNGYYVVKDLWKKEGKTDGGKPCVSVSQDDGGGKRKGAIIVSVAVVLVLAIIGLLIWKPWGGSKKADYVLEIQMKNKTMIEDVEFDLEPRSELAQLKMVSNTKSVAWIDLFTGWNKLSFTVETIGEGTCDKIELEERVIGTNSTPQLITPYLTKQVKKDTLVISLESPAWNELNQIHYNDIRGYAKIAEDYKSSPTVRKACVDKAFKDVYDNSDTIPLLKFVTEFAKIREAKDELKTINYKLDTLRIEAKNAANAAAVKQEKLDTFKAKLQTVYSINCTKNAVADLKMAYENVKAYEEMGNCMAQVLPTALDEVAFKVLLDKQAEFFKVFNKDFSEARSLINSYRGTYTSKFSDDQREYMQKLVESEFVFGYYKDHIGQNVKYYQFIKNNYDEVKNLERKSVGDLPTERTTENKTPIKTIRL